MQRNINFELNIVSDSRSTVKVKKNDENAKTFMLGNSPGLELHSFVSNLLLPHYRGIFLKNSC